MMLRPILDYALEKNLFQLRITKYFVFTVFLKEKELTRFLGAKLPYFIEYLLVGEGFEWMKSFSYPVGLALVV